MGWGILGDVTGAVYDKWGDIGDEAKKMVGLGPADTAATKAAVAGQSDFADTLKAAYGDAGPRGTPQVQQAQGGAAQLVSAPLLRSAPQVNAGVVGQPGAIAGARVAPIQQVRAGSIGTPNLGQALQASGSMAGNVNVARPSGMDPRLGTALSLQEAAARGDAPSVAQGQMRRGLDEAIAAQMGAAASARGRNIGLAQRGAMMQGARMQQKAVVDSAMLRADEMAKARDAFAASVGAARGQDIGMATTDANAQNSAMLQNATLASDISKYNATAANNRTLDQANMGVDIGKFNAGQSMQAQLANQGVDAAARMAEAGYGQDASKFNTSTAVDVNKTNASNALTAAQASADLLQRGQFQQADLDAAAQGKNAEFVNSLAMEMAKLGVQVNTTNAKLILESRGVDDDHAEALAQLINQAYGNQITGGVAVTSADAAQNNKLMRVAGAAGGAAVGGPAGAAAGSKIGGA